MTDPAATRAPIVGGPKHDNNLGLLRLFFAALVIVSHAPEQVDGNRSRELLTRIFGAMSFGEVAVDAFFLVSGYLISQSFARTPAVLAYMARRIGRIVPGYLISFALCFFALAPLVGGRTSIFSMADLGLFVQQASRLLPPDVAGAFATLPHPALNGSMWTIAYEFRCYIAVAVLGLLFGKQPWAVPVLACGVAAALAIAVSGIVADRHVRPIFEENAGQIGPTIRFAGVFGAGALFYLLRQQVPLKGIGALMAATCLVIGMSNRWTAEPSFAVFGGYLIFYAAFRLPTSRLSRLTDRTDISYGLYLYAWPIGNTIIDLDRGVDPWLLCLATLITSAMCGLASWVLIEKPAIRFAHRFRWRRALSAASSTTTATA